MTRRQRRDLVIDQKRAALAYAARDISQQELAEEFGVTQSTISRYIKLGELAILAECNIKEADSPSTVRAKASRAGYHDTSDIQRIHGHCVRRYQKV